MIQFYDYVDYNYPQIFCWMKIKFLNLNNQLKKIKNISYIHGWVRLWFLTSVPFRFFFIYFFGLVRFRLKSRFFSVFFLYNFFL